MEWFENEDGTLKCFGHAYEYNRQSLHCAHLMRAGRCNEQTREKCWNQSDPHEGESGGEAVGNIIQFPVFDPNGVCPVCKKNDGYRNIYKTHWFICHKHKVKWCVGRNLFSSWTEETEEDWKQNASLLAGYREVEPYFGKPPPSWLQGERLDELDDVPF